MMRAKVEIEASLGCFVLAESTSQYFAKE